MRYPSSSSVSVTQSLKEGKGSNNHLSPRLRKKHKRLDAICEKEYSRNHGDSNEGSGGIGGENNNDDVEIRRSSRVRRAPVVLDVSPPPRKKRKKFGNKNVGSGSGKKANSSPVVRDSEGLESPGSWRSRLRSRGGNSRFRVKEEREAPRGKRKLFEEIEEEGGEERVREEDGGEERVRGKEIRGAKGELEVGKYTVVKSKRPGRVKASYGSKSEEKVISLDDGKDEGMEELGVAGNRGNGDELQLDNDLGGSTDREVGGDETQLVENKLLQSEDGCIWNDTTEAVNRLEAAEHAGKTVEELDDGEDQSDILETNARSENKTNFVAIEQNEKQGERVDGEKNPDDMGVVASSTNETESTGCPGGADIKQVELDEEPHVEANGVKVDSSKCATRGTLRKPRIKEGRRCGLCGGGNDGKPPKPVAHDTVESENDVYSGSSGSEEPNYDIWDGFGDEAGWLGRLLGPINDRFGIAGTWVHQHCAVWSPEVYFAGLGCLKNVRAALCRGRALKCTRCGRPGATIGCRVDRCPKTYHLPCARANGCIFDHRKFLIACTDHRHIFQPHGVHNLARIKKVRLKKMKLELRKHANEASRKDIDAEEKWFENCGEDEEFLKRESKRLHRDLARIAPVYIGGKDSENGRSFQGWESVAGLQDVIQCMKEVVILPLLYPEFFDNLGLTPPRGILLHGYPGTGKTLVVRALIGACARGDKRIAYFARKGADCLGKYVGDAERQLRLLFQVAEKCQPSLIFFDEIDGLAPCRTRRQDQTHSSVVSTLLALMDGLKSRGSVIVVGATNRPDAIDPALRRPGRFDREIYFPLPSLKDRAAILSLHTQRWPKQVTGSLLQWIARRTAGFAGADLQALCTQAAITGLNRTFPLQETLSAAEKRASCSKLIPLPNFAVEERDWLEALSRCPPPCSRREAGIAASEVVSSSLPFHLIPCLLKPLATLLVSLHLEEHISLPARLSKAACMIKSVMVSTLAKRKLQSNHWWSFLEDLIQEADVAEEIERNLLDSGILIGDDSIAASNDFGEESVDSNDKFKPCMKRNGKTHMNLSQHTSFPPTNKSGFRLLIAGNPRSGQRHLASCLVHCFVGNVEIQKVDLATISQEGHGDAVQGITQIFMRCASVNSCVIFMPRMDLWAVEKPQQVVEESDALSTTHQLPRKDGSDIGHDYLAEKENIIGPQKCKSAEKVEGQGVTRRTSNAWSLFVEQVESISVSTSLMILATSEVPFSTLPIEIRQFFKINLSNFSGPTFVEHTVPRLVVQVDGDFNHDLVLDICAAKITRDVVQQLIQLSHHRSHTKNTSSEEYEASDFIGDHASMVNRTAGYEVVRTQCEEQSIPKTALPPNNRTGKGRSNLHLAISSFGYQILRYPHFAELCWFTSKLKEGPSAEVTGPWKGWPFNSCIIRPSNSAEKITLASSSGNVKIKEKPGLVRGLIAVGLSAYKGVYTSLREVSSEIRKVLELLVGEINEKVQAGKDRNQYVRLLSQVAYLEDKVNSWAYTLQSLELDAPDTVDSSKLNGAPAPDNKVQCEEGRPDASSKCFNESKVPEENSQGLADDNIEYVDLNKEDGDFACPNPEGGITTTDGSQQKVVPMSNSMPDIQVDNSEGSNQVVGDILNGQNVSCPEQSVCENNGNTMLLDTDSGCLEHSNGFACMESAVISEDGLGSREFVAFKCSRNQIVFGQIPGFHGKNINEPKPDAEDDNVKNASSLPNADENVNIKSGDVCLYRCCSECLNHLHNLVKKFLIHEWELDKNHRTVDDVHDVVSSLSVDLVSTVRRVYDDGVLGRKMRKDEKLFESNKVLRTCQCKGSENGIVVPVKCSCHSKSLDTSHDNPHSAPEMKFVFRAGVLVHMDTGKDVSFHCKIETLCLCHLIESIQTINQPSG